MTKNNDKKLDLPGMPLLAGEYTSQERYWIVMLHYLHKKLNVDGTKNLDLLAEEWGKLPKFDTKTK